jgi:hypothetical protein
MIIPNHTVKLLQTHRTSRFMGHANVTTTLGVYAHLFNTDDHADAMAALGAMAAPNGNADNVIRLRG